MMINSKKYFKYVNTHGQNYNSPGYPEYLRDSLHYIVNSSGTKFFSSQDFTNHLHQRYQLDNTTDTMVRYTIEMKAKDAVTATPLGNFTTSTSQLEIYMYPNYNNTANPRYKNVRYARNIGIVTKMLDFYFNSPKYTELRLVRYHVE